MKTSKYLSTREMKGLTRGETIDYETALAPKWTVATGRYSMKFAVVSRSDRTSGQIF